MLIECQPPTTQGTLQTPPSWIFAKRWGCADPQSPVGNFITASNQCRPEIDPMQRGTNLACTERLSIEETRLIREVSYLFWG
jgi:hypothetical protein